EASGRNADEVRASMESLRQSGRFTLSADTLSEIRSVFGAERASVAETAETIRDTLAASGYLADPHTATALKAARAEARPGEVMVVLATAHPAKFPEAVEEASGVRPSLPPWLEGLMEEDEEFAVLSSDLKMVEDHISRHGRAALRE